MMPSVENGVRDDCFKGPSNSATAADRRANAQGTLADQPHSFFMARYYFDLRDEQGITRDDEGLELDGIHLVHEEAVKSLAEIVLKGSLSPEIAVEVRDRYGALAVAKFTRLRAR